jgi:PAB-dependent poly(A)-specific ribonuclease subunit 2
MPYYKEQLLSSWPSHLVSEVGAPAPKLDNAILSTMTRTELGFFAKNPRTKRRNQAEGTRLVDRVSDSLSAPKFLSEKTRASLSFTEHEARSVETMEALTDLHLDDVTRKDVPAMYGNVEIKYSKFGVDDFDFAYVFRSFCLPSANSSLDIITRPHTLVWRLTYQTHMPIHSCNSSASHR